MSVYNDTLNSSNFTNYTDSEEDNEGSYLGLCLFIGAIIGWCFCIIAQRYILEFVRCIPCFSFRQRIKQIYREYLNRRIERRLHQNTIDATDAMGSMDSITRYNSISNDNTFFEPDNYFVVVIQKQHDVTPTNEECPICLEPINKNQDTIKLDCTHQYHQTCLMSWIENQLNSSNSSSCPLCRNDIKYKKLKK